MSGVERSTHSSRHVVIRAARVLDCISSSASSQIVWVAGSISTASPTRERKYKSSCLARHQQGLGRNRPRDFHVLKLGNRWQGPLFAHELDIASSVSKVQKVPKRA